MINFFHLQGVFRFFSTTRNVSILFGAVLGGVILLASPRAAAAQENELEPDGDAPVYVDENGVMRNRQTNDEVTLFGVNYSVPFAHEFRAFNKLGHDYKTNIDKDVYHLARMGVDAFRLHIWDTEISDSLGNVQSNKHLELLDYLIWKLKQRNIKIILTPITYYDNGYPDGATPTDGFANYIPKEDAPKNREYWPVLQRYLRQFVNHENEYTGTSYKNDPSIIALEIVNEPAHDDVDRTRTFVNRMADGLRRANWEKPIFYNISQNPSVAEGVMTADVDGVSFQWYPAGLVGGKEIEKNYLPYVDEYPIPFSDAPAFQSKAQMVYEFSPADVPRSYPYAAMARSFREAGFQFATQFAYDPMAIADINTAWRTHYLNLAYTPSKAIGFRIASEAFHRLDRSQEIPPYPADTTFGNVRVRHASDLAVLNADTSFAHTHSTTTQPKAPDQLRHVSGVGSSPVVSYSGTGAYFLDRLEEGVWRLEVMPDAIPLRNPFAVTAFDKKLVHIDWREHEMALDLPDLGNSFRLRGLNDGNETRDRVDDGSFSVTPGTYLLVERGTRAEGWTAESRYGTIQLGEFAAPEPSPDSVRLRYEPVQSVKAGDPMTIEATVAGLKPSADLTVRVQRGFQPQRIEMEEYEPYQYRAQIPAEDVSPGVLRYWITVEQAGEQITFPGPHRGTPGAWNYHYDDQWEVEAIPSDAPLEIFRAREDAEDINYAFSFWSTDHRTQTTHTSTAGQRAVEVTAGSPMRYHSNSALGWTYSLSDEWSSETPASEEYTQLGVRARADSLNGAGVRAILVDETGRSYSAPVDVQDSFTDHRLALAAFEPDSMMLTPRPYPIFLPLWYEATSTGDLEPAAIEELQFLLVPGPGGQIPEGATFAIESAWLE